MMVNEMTNLDYKINKKIMDILGFEEGYRRRLYDQDSGNICKIGDKEIVSPKNMSGRNAIEFDPINNPKMMNYVFGLYLNKKYQDEEIERVLAFYIVRSNDDDSKKCQLIIKFEDGSMMTSSKFNNETTCIAECILRLDQDFEDVSVYDIDRRKNRNTVKPISKFKK